MRGEVTHDDVAAALGLSKDRGLHGFELAELELLDSAEDAIARPATPDEPWGAAKDATAGQHFSTIGKACSFGRVSPGATPTTAPRAAPVPIDHRPACATTQPRA
ncbi:MAG: hypothetical protein K0U84_02440 [Actinomycetia bacterium]|nr:hypothetical protein [Actinomycetes bacterium]